MDKFVLPGMPKIISIGPEIVAGVIMDFSRGNIKFIRDQTVLSDLT